MAQPKITVSDLTVGVGDTYADVIVSLSAPSQSTVTVSYATADWGANSNDYSALSGKLSFNPGETTKVVRLEIEDRFNDIEVAARFKLVLSSPTNATLGREGYGWVTIVDKDSLKDNPEIHVRDIVVDESAGTATFHVTLCRQQGQGANGIVSVDFATMDGTATAGSDYVGIAGTLTFLPGESVKAVTVELLNDATPETVETFSLLLSNAATGIIVRNSAIAMIGANDGLPTTQPRLSVAELTMGEGATFTDVVVSLSGPSLSKVTAAYKTVDATANSNDSYALSGTFTFEPGETVKVVRIEIEDRFSDVEAVERFKLQLSAPTGATLNGDGSSWINIVDNNTVSENPNIVESDIVVDEKAGTALACCSRKALSAKARASSSTPPMA